MYQKAYGYHTEANPRYQEAVHRQQEKERLRQVAVAPINKTEPTPVYVKPVVEAKKVVEAIIFDIYAEPTASSRPSAIKIIAETADRHGLKVSALKSNIRYREVVRARQEAMARLYLERPDLSLPAIGRLFGGRDHTTVLHGIMKMGVHHSQTGVERPAYVHPGNFLSQAA